VCIRNETDVGAEHATLCLRQQSLIERLRRPGSLTAELAKVL
jgi:hypothetical protein